MAEYVYWKMILHLVLCYSYQNLINELTAYKVLEMD